VNIDAYLARIGIDHRPEPTAAALKGLQKAHLFTVPYENLDILAGKPLSLDRDALFDKIVTRHRGGFCFELNELFGHLLRGLGYEVTDSFGRFLRGETVIPMRRHHVLLVKAADDDTRYLADVGVGSGSPTFPMRLTVGETLHDRADTYRLRTDDFLGWVVEEIHDGQWRDVYSFTEERQLPVDFVTTCFYCEHAPESPFNKAEMVSLRTENGRKTRDGGEFRLFADGDVKLIHPRDDREADRLMRDWFDLNDRSPERP